MKRIIQGLLAAVFAVSANTVAGDLGAAATYLSVRPAGDYAMSLAHGELASGSKDALGGQLTADVYYRRLNNTLKNFGAYTASSYSNQIEVKSASTIGLTPGEIAYANNSIDSVATLTPAMNVWGAHLNYNQSLSSFVDGLWFGASTDVVRSEQVVTVTADDSKVTTYFAGEDVAVPNQKKLDFGYSNAAGLPEGAPISRIGFADVNVRLGYTFVNEADYAFGAHVNAVVPTGFTKTAERLFEPTFGTASFALGGGVTGRVNVWRADDKKSKLDFVLGGAYKYRFEATEKRVAGIADAAGAIVDLGQYKLAGKVSEVGVTPAANYLVQDMKITAGSNFQANAGLEFAWNNFSFDVAYNLWYQDKETGVLANTWTNAQVGIMKTGQNIANAATTSSFTAINAETTTGAYSISLAPALTQSQTTHSVVGGMSYVFNKDGKMPIALRGGAHYEFAGSSKDVTPETWGVQLGAGFAF